MEFNDVNHHFNVLDKEIYDTLLHEIENTQLFIKDNLTEHTHNVINITKNKIIYDLFQIINGDYDVSISKILLYIQSCDDYDEYQHISDISNSFIFCFAINKNKIDINTNDISKIIKSKKKNVNLDDNKIHEFKGNYKITKDVSANDNSEFYSELLGIDNHGLISLKQNISDSYGFCYHHIDNSLIVFPDKYLCKLKPYHFLSKYKSISLFFICK